MSRLLKLFGAFERYESRPCIEGRGLSHSYLNLANEVERWQLRLDEMGISTGHVVGLRADYSLFSVASLFALVLRKAVPALIPRDKPPVDYLEGVQASHLLEIAPDGTYSRVWLGRPPNPHPLLDRASRNGESSFVIFTSGTTGQPKAALHSLERFLHKLDRPGRALRTLAFLLFDHVAGLDTLFYTLWHGGTLILTYRRDPQAILDLIASEKVDVLPTSPSFLRMLCALKATAELDLSSLKVVTYGSEPMDPVTLNRLNARFPNAQITQKYGATEIGSPRTISKANDSLWIKIKEDGVETRIVDGVLWLRTTGTMLGYLNAPCPITDDGWYCTGDQVQSDGEWIQFVGRADDIINVGGEKVTPTDVERVIRELDYVCDVVVFGESHPIMGKVVAARVAIRPSPSPGGGGDTVLQIRQHCRRRLASYQIPLKIEISDTDPLEAMGYRMKARRLSSP